MDDPSELAKLFELMVRASADGMLAIDDGGRVRFANAAAEEMLGRTSAELLGAEFGLPLATDDPIEVELFHPRRGTRVSELRVVRTPDGTFVAMLRDVSQRVRLRNELQRLALADQLTGVGNRRAFLALAEQALKLAEREARDCLLVFVDVDDMKVINDRFGHRAGDRAVIETARMLTDTVRDSDIVARVGGDEFCVLLTGSTGRTDAADEALGRLEKVAETVGERVDFPLTVTIGAARFDPHDPRTVEEMMDAADEQMYRAKRARKQQSCVLVIGAVPGSELLESAISSIASLASADTISDAALRMAGRPVDAVLISVSGATLDEDMATLREWLGRDNCPVLTWAVDADPDLEARALAAGAEEFLHAGMSATVVAARLDRVLKRIAGR